MGLYSVILLASIYASASLGGTLEVIDYNGQCLVYSAGNYGCTGYSAPFGLLNGSDCSGRLYFYYFPAMMIYI